MESLRSANSLIESMFLLVEPDEWWDMVLVPLGVKLVFLAVIPSNVQRSVIGVSPRFWMVQNKLPPTVLVRIQNFTP